MKKNVIELHSTDLLKIIEKVKKYHDQFNVFETIIADASDKKNIGSLSGIPYVLSDNISTSDILTTGSSNILKDYIPVYDATIYKKLKEEGAVLIGKTIIDELGLSNTGMYSHIGMVKNPVDKTRIIGGSSSGSAAAVASGLVPFAIGSDTLGDVRKPAAYSGIVGFKPTYGRISRHGVFAFASSFDTVAIFTNSVKDSALITSILKGQDEFDMTTLVDDNLDYIATLNDDIKGKKLFYFKDICDSSFYKDNKELTEILKNYELVIKKCKELGFIVEEIDFDKELLSLISPVSKIIAYSEATSNTANLTGIPFGERGKGADIEELITDARTKGFSNVTKKHLIMGNYFLQKENQEQLFFNTGRVRRLLVDKINELFTVYEGLILPTTGSIAPKLDSNLNENFELILDNFLALANFGGYPSITIPSGVVDGMPVGINIMGSQMNDSLVLNIAYKLEQVIGFEKDMEGDSHV
ncbi:MAG: amidase family protein [Bacilli bacterium]|nr:amidase family protein [Bacilli bacterium]MDD4718831.1 amidase family protein [Bacilli bacterium]